MKIFLFALLFPCFLHAQKPIPRLEGDSLYTSSGFVMYKGQTLHCLNGSGKNDKFQYLDDFWRRGFNFTGASLTIKRFSGFKVSSLGNGFVWVDVDYVSRKGHKNEGVVRIAFDLAQQPLNDRPPEFEIPEQYKHYRNRQTGSTADEIKKLKDLLDSGAITKDEYDIAKKKILEKQ